MSKFDWALTIIVVCWLALIMTTEYVEYNYVKACHAAGGESVIGNKGSLCINPSAVIEVD